MFPPSRNVWPVRDPGDDTVTTYPQSPIIPNNARKIKNKTVRRRGHWGALGTSVRRVTPPPFARTVPQGDAGLETSAERPELPISCPQRRGRKPREGDRPRFSAKRGKKAAEPGALGQAPHVWGGPERGPRRPWLFGSLPSAITPPAFLGCYLRTPAVSGRREREVWSTRLHCDVVIDRRALGPLRQPLA